MSRPLARLSILAALVAACLVAARGSWAPLLASSLACSGDLAGSDAILIENLENHYLLFERAAQLQQAGYASRVLVLVQASMADGGKPGRVPVGVAAVMSDIAGLKNTEILTFQEVEPVSMTAAYQVRESSLLAGVRSLIVVTDGFRSRRTLLAYSKALGPLSVNIRCVPVWGRQTPANWMETWHGIQTVLLQTAKLHYYRVWVL